MLRGFRRPKFVTKCKSDIKLLKLRLEAIKKKRGAVQKYLKNDIADLLRSGLGINAYGRAEGLLVEQNMSACYELIENFIGCISNNLSLMQNQSECPEDCKEAVPSLMYAAARFADLPELRDLRNVFTEKYGNSLESFVSKEFVERLRSKPPTKDMKSQLLHDIGQEFSIEWDSKALEQKLYTPPPPEHGNPRYASPGNSDDDMHKSYQRKDNAFPSRRNKDRLDYTASVGSEVQFKSHGSKDAAYDKHKRHSSSEDESTTDISIDAPIQSSSSVGSVSGDEADVKIHFHSKFAPPPYYKPRPERKEIKFEVPAKEEYQASDILGIEDNSKPKSVRRTKLKPPPGRENFGRNDRTIHGDDSDPRDEEERKMDELLLHYSKKQLPHELSQPKGNLKPCLDQADDDNGESAGHRSRRSQRGAPSARALSLPLEPTPPVEAPKVHARAKSSLPDAHVHPKLPEYDELAARIAALRGT